MQTLNVGIIGTGNIAPAYIRGCAPFDVIQLTACADILPKRAEAFAAEHGLAALSVDDLLASDDIDIVINLTVPLAHAEVSLQIIEAGKHAYCEKPLAVNREDGARVVSAAREAGLRIGCAPDTFLGGGGQTARKVIDDGADRGAGGRHGLLAEPRPRALAPERGLLLSQGRRTSFRHGALLLDRPGQSDGAGSAGIKLGAAHLRRASRHQRGSYGPAVAGRGQHSYRRHTRICKRRHRLGHSEFRCLGAITCPRSRFTAKKGSLSVPDPNRFDGDVRLLQGGTSDWKNVPLTHTTNIGRGAGIADMA